MSMETELVLLLLAYSWGWVLGYLAGLLFWRYKEE